jgi:hypothetical protein
VRQRSNQISKDYKIANTSKALSFILFILTIVIFFIFVIIYEEQIDNVIEFGSLVWEGDKEYHVKTKGKWKLVKKTLEKLQYSNSGGDLSIRQFS